MSASAGRILTTHVGSLPRRQAVTVDVGIDIVSDCGFGTFAGPVEPDIAYLKLKSLVEGARIASRRLWG